MLVTPPVALEDGDRGPHGRLDGVVDETNEVFSDALYVLLRHAAMLPQGPDTLGEAETPNPQKLWQEPQRYRGRACSGPRGSS